MIHLADTNWAVTDDGWVFPAKSNPIYANSFCVTFCRKSDAEAYAKEIKDLENKYRWLEARYEEES